MKTKDSISTSLAVASRRLEMDFEEGRRPYSLEEDFTEGRRSIRHKRSSESLILEDLVRKCREDNERIIYIQERIMNDLKSLNTIQISIENSHKKVM